MILVLLVWKLCYLAVFLGVCDTSLASLEIALSIVIIILQVWKLCYLAVFLGVRDHSLARQEVALAATLEVCDTGHESLELC